MAACVNLAPEGLLGAAVAEVGVLDLLKVRFLRRSSSCSASQYDFIQVP